MYTGYQLFRFKRFREIVICSTLKPLNTILRRATRGQHQDWDIGALSNAFQYVKAGNSGQHYIENNQLEMFLLR